MLLRLITLPYVRKHLLRASLTIAGIVLGVAVFVGMHSANRSVLGAFQRTVDKIAGKAQLQITAGEGGFDEAVLETVQAMPQVAAAAPVIEATIDTSQGDATGGGKAGGGQGSILVLAVDFTGDRSLRDYDLESGDEAVIDDPLIFLAQPDSLMITREFAERNGLKSNSRITLATMEGPRQFVVRGIMKAGGMSSAFGGNLAIMDIYAAQKMFGRGRKFDRIDLAVAGTASIDSVRDELRRKLGPAFTVEPPSARGGQFESLLKVYSMTANITSVFALFIGMFIIYNTFEIAVGQRRTEIGILRALGATQAQIRNLFLVESALTGLTGSIIGAGLGLLMAKGMAASLSGLIEQVYGVAQEADRLEIDWLLLAGATVAGVVTSVLAGWIPARDAARIDPVKAIQKGQFQMIAAGESRVRTTAAFVALAGAALCTLVSDNRIAFYGGYLLAIVAAVLVAPLVSVLLAKVLRPFLGAISPVEGRLAADSILQAPRRTSGAIAALMLSLAMVVALGGMTQASYASIRRWLDIALNPDLYVTTSQSLTDRNFRFPASMEAEVKAVAGVAEVQAVRSMRVAFRGTPVMLVAVDIESVSSHATLDPVEGDTKEMNRKAARGEGVIVSENFSLLYDVHLGDTVDVPTPTGKLSLPVVGVTVDYSDQQGSILMERRVFQKLWNDDSVNIFRIYVEKGQPIAKVRQRLLDALGNRSKLFVLTNEDVRSYILTLTDQWFAVTYVQLFVAVLVAVLGIINSLTVSITDRRRELGVLQAVGGLRWQVRRAIWLEAATIAIIGLVAGLAAGGVNLYYILEVTRRDLAGMRLPYEFPLTLSIQLVPFILAAALLAAIGPGESAVRASLVEALEYE